MDGQVTNFNAASAIKTLFKEKDQNTKTSPSHLQVTELDYFEKPQTKYLASSLNNLQEELELIEEQIKTSNSQNPLLKLLKFPSNHELQTKKTNLKNAIKEKKQRIIDNFNRLL